MRTASISACLLTDLHPLAFAWPWGLDADESDEGHHLSVRRRPAFLCPGITAEQVERRHRPGIPVAYLPCFLFRRDLRLSGLPPLSHDPQRRWIIAPPGL